MTEDLSVGESKLYEIIKAAAEAGEACPSNYKICRLLDYASPSTPVKLMAKLASRGLIRVERFQKGRIVEIVATGKKTLGPEKRKPHWRDRPPRSQARPRKVTHSGRPPEIDDPNSPAPGPINPETGMHTDYWVLSEEERAKGFVRPVRLCYVHSKCGGVTQISQKIAETFAREPKFYGATFCVDCREHRPVQEFTWDGTQEKVGS